MTGRNRRGCSEMVRGPSGVTTTMLRNGIRWSAKNRFDARNAAAATNVTVPISDRVVMLFQKSWR